MRRIRNKTVSITGFAKENAAMTSVLATCKTAAERSDNIAAMWSTNARKNRADKAYKMHSEVQMRDNEHYDPTLAAMFIAHTFTTQPIQESVSSSASLCIYGWKKNGKEEVEAFLRPRLLAKQWSYCTVNPTPTKQRSGPR